MCIGKSTKNKLVVQVTEKRSVWENSILASKGKATPLQAWTGPEGSSRLRLPDFKTIGT